MGTGRSYVQYGAGWSCPDGWTNFDASPALRIQKIPILGKMVIRGDERFPDKVRYGDIVKGLPVPAGSATAVYCSHVLEHLSLDDMRTALRNTLNILAPGGIFRCVLPDLQERVRRYIFSFESGCASSSIDFMNACYLGQKSRPRGIIKTLRTTIGNSAHLWMWDELSLGRELIDAGFTSIRRCSFNDSGDPMFKYVESRDRFYDLKFTPEIVELAMEARRPV